jgi:hypothetical protein
MKDICSHFSFFYTKIKNNGVYFAEDLHTVYWGEFGGELGKSDSFIEYSKTSWIT